MDDALAVVERFEALAVNRPPEVVLEEARRAARALTTVIEGKKKKVVFNGETYLENEDWLTVARFYGVTSRISGTRYIEYGDVRGFEATAEAFLPGIDGGQVISMADAMCLNDEPNWSKKPLFQLRSMAQTRASSRVLRQVFGWVVVLAGYKPTPAEEMDSIGNSSTRKATVPAKPTGDAKCSECNAVGGHLPKCSKRQGATPAQPSPAKVENTMCGSCGQVNGHTKDCQYAPKPKANEVAAVINSVEEKLKKANKEGVREPYLVLHITDQDNLDWDLLVWHQSMHPYLRNATKQMLVCDYSQKTAGDRTYCSLEVIHELAGVPYVDGKPAQQGEMPAEEDF